MSRGGKRKGAGRKSTWSSNYGNKDTVSIRVPKCLKAKLLTIAHELDEGKEITTLSPEEKDSATQINDRLEKIENSLKAIAKALEESQELRPSTKSKLKTIYRIEDVTRSLEEE